eukprot:8866-Heterococcus_DN1.PRE.2
MGWGNGVHALIYSAGAIYLGITDSSVVITSAAMQHSSLHITGCHHCSDIAERRAVLTTLP